MLELGVPVDATTCHVAEIDGYVVAGHVPVEAITALLAQRPDAVGVVVPGMPIDSPGMGGDHEDWLEVEVMLIGRGGALSAFDF
jgi:hypothetical protein